MVRIKTKQSFKSAIADGEDKIKVEDWQLAKWIVRIYGIRPAVWSIAASSIAAVIVVDVATGGTGSIASALVFAPAIFIIGIRNLTAMVSLGTALGGITGLNVLRKDYRIARRGKDYVIIERKR